ncbi:hypothetical protein HOLleu_14336 [Holothuria leucospilota]|uniref:BRCT domain-containing protein n=1 Tax=Holothuria leucospilota TaxID=206669 RepID=A0A9Q1C6C1_HOLLE|nr:hypothetical protein HOLleu_14336 [Holothuria leucospilota]
MEMEEKLEHRASTFLSISLLNNNAKFHGVKFQSPKEVFPIMMFYEKDSRDNLEENLGYPSQFDRFLSQSPDKFFLSGDEMFLVSMLTESGLGPTSIKGWNIYCECDTASKALVSARSGLRTDLPPKIDRQHSSSILKSIPLDRTVFCCLHVIARIVEKLLMLVVEYTLSEANKIRERGGDATSYVEDRIHHLVKNISLRGIRQGNFNISLENGMIVPIKLNKVNAWVILNPVPNGLVSDIEYVHVLENVVGERKIPNTMDPLVTAKFAFPDTFVEVDPVKQIWHEMYCMQPILSQDANPRLLEGKPVGSNHPDDYAWNVEEKDILAYKDHAERYYQLFKMYYGCEHMTPYMIKYIDYGAYFLKNLPIPMSRFQAEGGEHVNYDHNRFYFQHTTRHGGKQFSDPFLAIFHNMWRRICFDISSNKTFEGQKAAVAFNQFRRRHMAAVCIQRAFRRCRSGKLETQVRPKTSDGVLFQDIIFVLCGNVPEIDGTSYTKPTFIDFIKSKGGRVRSSVPKCSSTKKFVTLAQESVCTKKLPETIRIALQKGYPVVGHSYVTETVKKGKPLDMSTFTLSCLKKF